MYSLQGHPRCFKLKKKYQQYGFADYLSVSYDYAKAKKIKILCCLIKKKYKNLQLYNNHKKIILKLIEIKQNNFGTIEIRQNSSHKVVLAYIQRR